MGPVITSQIADFTRDLRELRSAAGAPSYAELSRRTGLPRSTLHDGLRGERLPSLELTVAVVRALGGDEAAWRQRWVDLRATLEDPDPAPAAPRVPRRLVLVVALAVLVVGGGVAGALVRAGGGRCTTVREYRATSAGAVLSADGTVIGQTRAGDTIEVRSLAHDRYPHRYYGTDLRTGDRGYLDEARLAFRRERCA